MKTLTMVDTFYDDELGKIPSRWFYRASMPKTIAYCLSRMRRGTTMQFKTVSDSFMTTGNAAVFTIDSLGHTDEITNRTQKN